MSAPTPADVFGRAAAVHPDADALGARAQTSAPFFGVQFGRVAQARSLALADVVRGLERTLTAARSLRDERDLDLRLELFRREVDRLDDALARLDDALDDPDGPRPPAPRALPRT